MIMIMIMILMMMMMMIFILIVMLNNAGGPFSMSTAVDTNTGNITTM